jgi:hypothetical protein
VVAAAAGAAVATIELAPVVLLLLPLLLPAYSCDS